MSSSKYWQKRRQDMLDRMEKDEEKLNAKLNAAYTREFAKLDTQIASYYQKYGEDNVIEYRKLMQDLSDSDRRLLMERMDEFAKKYPEYAHLMPVRESIYKLNELEGLQTSILMQQLEIGAIEQKDVDEHLKKQALRSANLAAEEMGFGTNFYSIDSSIIKATVSSKWAQGKSFSDRIWDNRRNLASYLNDDLAKMFARGVTYEQCAKEMSERFINVSQRNISRLVYTEGTYVFNEAHANVHEQDFEFYALSTVGDGKVCSICREIATAQETEPVRFKDRSPGTNFPPLHPWCRCSYIVADDLDKWLDEQLNGKGQQNAEHAETDVAEAEEQTGKKLHIDRDAEVYKGLDDKYVDVISDIIDNADCAAKRVYLMLEDQLRLADAHHIPKKGEAGAFFITRDGVHLNIEETFNDSIETTLRTRMNTWFHEFGHNIDRVLSMDSLFGISGYFENGLLRKTIAKETGTLIKRSAKAHKNDVKEIKKLADNLDVEGLIKKGALSEDDGIDFNVVVVMKKSLNDKKLFEKLGWDSSDVDTLEKRQKILKGEITKCPAYKKAINKKGYEYLQDDLSALPLSARSDLSDILEGATNGKIKLGWGHGEDYWEYRDRVSSEAFAEITSAYMTHPESLAVLKEYLPGTCAVYDAILDDVEKGLIQWRKDHWRLIDLANST